MASNFVYTVCVLTACASSGTSTIVIPKNLYANDYYQNNQSQQYGPTGRFQQQPTDYQNRYQSAQRSYAQTNNNQQQQQQQQHYQLQYPSNNNNNNNNNNYQNQPNYYDPASPQQQYDPNYGRRPQQYDPYGRDPNYGPRPAQGPISAMQAGPCSCQTGPFDPIVLNPGDTFFLANPTPYPCQNSLTCQYRFQTKQGTLLNRTRDQSDRFDIGEDRLVFYNGLSEHDVMQTCTGRFCPEVISYRNEMMVTFFASAETFSGSGFNVRIGAYNYECNERNERLVDIRLNDQNDRREFYSAGFRLNSSHELSYQDCSFLVTTEVYDLQDTDYSPQIRIDREECGLSRGSRILVYNGMDEIESNLIRTIDSGTCDSMGSYLTVTVDQQTMLVRYRSDLSDFNMRGFRAVATVNIKSGTKLVWLWVLLGILGLAIIILAIILIVVWRRRSKRNRQDKNERRRRQPPPPIEPYRDDDANLYSPYYPAAAPPSPAHPGQPFIYRPPNDRYSQAQREFSNDPQSQNKYMAPPPQYNMAPPPPPQYQQQQQQPSGATYAQLARPPPTANQNAARRSQSTPPNRQSGRSQPQYQQMYQRQNQQPKHLRYLQQQQQQQQHRQTPPVLGKTSQF